MSGPFDFDPSPFAEKRSSAIFGFVVSGATNSNILVSGGSFAGPAIKFAQQQDLTASWIFNSEIHSQAQRNPTKSLNPDADQKYMFVFVCSGCWERKRRLLMDPNFPPAVPEGRRPCRTGSYGKGEELGRSRSSCFEAEKQEYRIWTDAG